MKKTGLAKLGGIAVVLTLIALPYFAYGSAQDTQIKFVDAATYWKEAKCATCHGQKAEKKFNSALSDDEMVAAIMKGKKAEKPPHMPAYGAKGLTEDQAKELIAFMKSLKQ